MVKFNKYKLIINADDGLKIEKQFKSLKEIAKALNLEYYIIREIHSLNENKRKFLHNGLKLLTSKYTIENIQPNLINNIEPKKE